MPDNHLTGWRVLGAMTSPGGLGAGGQEGSHPGHPPSPSPHSRRVWRKKGRGLSASPPSRPHTHSRLPLTTSSTPYQKKGVYPICFLGMKYYIDLPCAFRERIWFRARAGGIAVYLLTVETRGKGGKTAFMRMSSNGKDISLPS